MENYQVSMGRQRQNVRLRSQTIQWCDSQELREFDDGLLKFRNDGYKDMLMRDDLDDSLMFIRQSQLL